MQAENYRIGCVGRTGQCRGAACRSRRCTGAINKLPLKWQILPICHCEEAIAFLTLARTSRRCGVGRGMPLPYSA